MSRPPKKTLEYIQIDTQDKTTLKRLTRKFGKEGRLFWWELLRLLARTTNYIVDLSDPMDMEDVFESELFVSKERGLEIISYLIEVGKVDRETWKKHKCIWIQNLIVRHGVVFEKRNEIPANPKNQSARKPEFPENKHPGNGVFPENQ